VKLFFKKIRKYALLSFLLLMFVLPACASEASSADGAGGIPSLTSTPASTQTSNQVANKNWTFVYANVEITIISIEQKDKFMDDEPPANKNILRLNLREQNMRETSGAGLSYFNNWRLVMSDGESRDPWRQKESGYIGANIVRTNWIDFDLDSMPDISKLVLHVGASDEQQVDVPLNGKGDLSKYQTHTTEPNLQFQYGTSNWTLLKAYSSLSHAGNQAKLGKRYITLDLSANNTGDKSIYVSTSRDVRLATASVALAPEYDSTIPNLPSHTAGASATLIFAMPDNETDLTLTFLTNGNENAAEVSVSFTI
jgi:hypothetical protein